MDRVEKFASVFCSGPEDYQCPKCGYFCRRKFSDSKKDDLTSVQIEGLISGGHAVYAGRIATDAHIDKYYKMGERYFRIRTVNGDATTSYRIFDRRESNNITRYLLPIMHCDTTGN